MYSLYDLSLFGNLLFPKNSFLSWKIATEAIVEAREPSVILAETTSID